MYAPTHVADSAAIEEGRRRLIMGRGDGTGESARPGANVLHMEGFAPRTDLKDRDVDEQIMTLRDSGEHERYTIVEDTGSETDGAMATHTRNKEIMDIIESVSDATIEDRRRQVQMEDEPFPKPKKMPLTHYRELCRALQVEKFLSPYIKSVKAPWSDLEITQLIRARDRTYCLWVPTKYIKMVKKVVKQALERITADQELASYEDRVSYEEMDTPVSIQRQAGGYSIVSHGMTCEYDIPGSDHIVAQENKKKSSICAFLTANSQYYFLGTSHLANLEGKIVHFRNENQHDSRIALGTVLHHAQQSNPFIEAFLGKIDPDNVQVGGGSVSIDEIHDGSIWELFGETISMPLEGGREMCEGKVEYFGLNKHCEDPDTGAVIDGSSLLYCRPIDCNNLSPPGSSGTGVLMTKQVEQDGGMETILAAMNLFSLLKENQTWAVCQHIVVPMGYFSEKLGSNLTLYNSQYEIPGGLATGVDVLAPTEDQEVKWLANHGPLVDLWMPWCVSHGAGIHKPADDPHGVDDFSIMRGV